MAMSATSTLPHKARTTAAAANPATTSLTPAQKEQWTADAKQSQTTGIVVLVIVVVFLVIVFSYVLIYILVRGPSIRI